MSKLLSIKLGELGKVSMCKRVLKNQTSEIGEIPFYKISTFGGEANCYISRKLFEDYRNKFSYPKKGDVLISASGTIGKTVIFDGKEAYFQDSNIVWIANDESKVLNDYLYYYYQLQPWNETTGATIERLYNENIRETIIKYPESIDEQRKIVKVLKSIDQKINNNEEINNNLEKMARTIFDYYFMQNNDKTTIKKLNELGNLLMGQSPKSDSYNTTFDGYPLINGAYELREKEIVINKYTSSPTRICSKDDLIFCIRATIGNLTYAEQEFCLGRGVASFTPYKKLDSEFLYFTLKDILNYYENTLTGSIIVGISKDDLLNQIIHYPDDAQIAKFHKLTLPMFEQIRKYKKENEVLNSYKKFLLPLMLEGKINLKLKEVV